jgi:hypothetical protein
MLALIPPDGGATLHRPPHIIHTNLATAVDRIPLDGSKGQLEQRIHDAKVSVADEVAMVWMPNKFSLNGKMVHEGTSVMSLLKVDGKWLITSSTDKMVVSQVNQSAERKCIC